tara:strand:- start:396 stop:1469 length:1074 start_codon:yes stop_codon:yes gene_type:complete
MKVYIKFFSYIFFKSLLYVLGIMLSLVFILNFLGELDFFQKIEIQTQFTIFLAILNSPSFIFDMFPFIFLITSQLFFIKLFNNNELITFKYSGLKNSKIILILISLSLVAGILIISIFYYFSSNSKNLYLELKSPFTNDGKYLAVITKNGLWIRDKIKDKILVINSSKVDQNYLIGSFITEFDSDYNVIRNIKSNKIDISKKTWLIYDAKVFKRNSYQTNEILEIDTNFDYKRINTLYSNLSSLNLSKLYQLRSNYKKLNYSVTEVDLHLLKLVTFPIFLVLMCLFSSLIMLRIKHLSSSTFKIALGLFFSVIIYYLNNFFYVLGSTEKITVLMAIIIPLLSLSTVNLIMLNKINEK